MRTEKVHGLYSEKKGTEKLKQPENSKNNVLRLVFSFVVVFDFSTPIPYYNPWTCFVLRHSYALAERFLLPSD
jgi:hypothetical protein